MAKKAASKAAKAVGLDAASVIELVAATSASLRDRYPERVFDAPTQVTIRRWLKELAAPAVDPAAKRLTYDVAELLVWVMVELKHQRANQNGGGGLEAARLRRTLLDADRIEIANETARGGLVKAEVAAAIVTESLSLATSLLGSATQDMRRGQPMEAVIEKMAEAQREFESGVTTIVARLIDEEAAEREAARKAIAEGEAISDG